MNRLPFTPADMPGATVGPTTKHKPPGFTHAPFAALAGLLTPPAPTTVEAGTVADEAALAAQDVAPTPATPPRPRRANRRAVSGLASCFPILADREVDVPPNITKNQLCIAVRRTFSSVRSELSGSGSVKQWPVMCCTQCGAEGATRFEFKSPAIGIQIFVTTEPPAESKRPYCEHILLETGNMPPRLRLLAIPLLKPEHMSQLVTPTMSDEDLQSLLNRMTGLLDDMLKPYRTRR